MYLHIEILLLPIYEYLNIFLKISMLLVRLLK